MPEATNKPEPDVLINLDEEEDLSEEASASAEVASPPKVAADSLDGQSRQSLNQNLRATLEQMRRDADDEIARLNRKLVEREHAAQQTASNATERLALEQELETLQHTLGYKEQTLEKITDECRRLEDQLEDKNVAFDGLRQEVERKESSLRTAQDEVSRLQRQLEEIRDQSIEVTQASEAFALPLPPVEPDPPAGPAQHVVTFSAGLMSGLVLLGVAALVVWGGIGIDWSGLLEGFSRPAPQPGIESEAPPPVAQAPGTPESAPTEVPEPVPTDSVPVAGPPTLPLPETQRDPLRDGSSGPTMVYLDGGRFRMGHNSMAGMDTGPEHDVDVPPFLIGAYEVTFEQYDRFVRATGRQFPDDYGWGRGDRPVVGVSWNDAEAYAQWLSSQTGRSYRLPSEAEWELAARGSSRGYYWWGFSMEPERAVCFDCGTQWDNRSTAPVGRFAANAYGLYDTAGNALEWVADCYSPGYDGAPIDGRPRLEGTCTFRVARGGAFNKPSKSMRIWSRAKLVPETRLNNLGFRVARDP